MKEYIQKKWPYYLGGLIIFLIILFESRGNGSDFNIFISASKDLLLKKNIYKIQYNDCYHYYYDVLFTLILVPFTYLPLSITKFFWLILNVFFVYRLWKIITEWLPISSFTKNNKIIFSVLSFILILSFLRDNFHLVQMTIFILYLSIEGLNFINKNKIIWGSFLLALGIDIKLLPLIFIPYLIYRNEWKSALYIIGFIILFLIIPGFIIGYDYNNFLLTERWHLINPLNQEHILDTAERSFHSLSTLLATLLVKNSGDLYALPLKRNIANISVEQLNIVINIVRCALLILTLYFLKTKPFKSTSNKLQKLYEISYIAIIIPLIFPHQQLYAFFFIFPATTYILFYIMYMFFNKETSIKEKHFRIKKISYIITLSVIYFLTNSHFILGAFNKYYDHFKTLTYGALILIILLAVCRPDKIIMSEQATHDSLKFKMQK